MRVLCTGTEGYIGAVAAPQLARYGHEVEGLDLGLYADGLLFEPERAVQDRIHHDIRRISIRHLRGFDAVVHLAELSHPLIAERFPGMSFRVNYQGTVQLAWRCKRAGVPRFVYVSSCDVYGGDGRAGPLTETASPRPGTAHSRYHLLVEQDLRAMADPGFSPVVLRAAEAFGPSPRMRFDLEVNELAGRAWTTGDVRPQAEAGSPRVYVHVLDLVRAIRTVLECPRDEVHNEVFNVGRDRTVSDNQELARLVADALHGHERPSAAAGAEAPISFEKIDRRLGFRCRHGLREGARQLVDLFSRIELTLGRFRSRVFRRFDQIEHLVETGCLDENLRWRQPEGARVRP